MKFLFKILILFVLVHPYSTSYGQSLGQLPPIDQSKEDPSFLTFKTELLKAIEKKDAEFIKKTLSKDVMFTFGPNEAKSPVEGFIKEFNLQNGKDSELWKALRTVVELGCTKTGESFTCPYVYSQWPDKFDSFEHIAVIKAKSPLRSKPQATASVIKSTDFDILRLHEDNNVVGWHVIRLEKNQKGYLAEADGRKSTDYRANFIKVGKDWKLTYFIAGD